jgi:hypothetical protein
MNQNRSRDLSDKQWDILDILIPSQQLGGTAADALETPAICLERHFVGTQDRRSLVCSA